MVPMLRIDVWFNKWEVGHCIALLIWFVFLGSIQLGKRKTEHLKTNTKLTN